MAWLQKLERKSPARPLKPNGPVPRTIAAESSGAMSSALDGRLGLTDEPGLEASR